MESKAQTSQGKSCTAKCAGCPSVIDILKSLKCGLCGAVYDLQCANVSEQFFSSTMTQDQKLSWKCQLCKCLQPRGDNSNTPVRNAMGVSSVTLNDSLDVSFLSQSTIARNVNMAPRGRQPGSLSADIMQSTLIDDSVYVENIRAMVREELQRSLDERLPNLNSNSVSKQLETLIQTVAALTTKVNVLESKVDLVLKLCISTKNPTGPAPSTGSVLRVDPAAVPSTSTNPVASTRIALSTGTVASENKVPPRGGQQGKPEFLRSKEKGRDVSAPNTASLAVGNQPRQEVAQPREALTSESAGSGWTEVRKRPRRSLEVTRGTAAPGATQLEASERQRHLHLYYVKLGTTVAQVRAYLSEICNEDVCSVESL